MYVFDVDQSNFEKIVIEGSQNIPVIVDFWAPWCGPCQVLKPMLEKLAEEYAGKFILAKINSDENQKLAGQFGVRGLPTVKAFYAGTVVNEFSGALPESEVRNFLNGIIPTPAQKLRLEAGRLYKTGDADGALQMLDESLQLEDAASVKIDKAHILVEQKKYTEAKSILDTLPINVKVDQVVVELLTQIDLATKSQDLPDLATLLEKVKHNENDLQSRLDLANYYIGVEQYQDAFEQLLEIVRQDKNFQDEAGRKTMLSLFTVLGNQNELVRQYRKQLAALLN